jgi:putative intracellular protease/amidase
MTYTIALFLHQPKCSVQSGNGIVKSLQSNYNFKIFTRHDLEADFFDDVDCIAIPGGIGDANSYDYLLGNHVEKIRKFVKRGGKYLGICMGAYWAGSNYLNILDGVDAVQYLTRPGTDTRRPHAKNINIEWQGTSMKMFWYDGCALVGDPSKFSTYARYSGNGDPMAIIQNNIGLIGAHPESQNHWYESYSWMRGKYHNGDHHQLLLEFANRLILPNTVV